MNLRKKRFNLKVALTLISLFVFTSCALPAFPVKPNDSSSNNNDTPSSEVESSEEESSSLSSSISSSLTSSSEDYTDLEFIKNKLNDYLINYGDFNLSQNFGIASFRPSGKHGTNENIDPEFTDENTKLKIDVKGDIDTQTINSLYTNIDYIQNLFTSAIKNINSNFSTFTHKDIGIKKFQGEDFVFYKSEDLTKVTKIELGYNDIPSEGVVGESKGIQTTFMFGASRLLYIQKYLNVKYKSSEKETKYGNHMLDVFCDIKYENLALSSLTFKGFHKYKLNNIFISKKKSETTVDIVNKYYLGKGWYNNFNFYKHYSFRGNFAFMIEIFNDNAHNVENFLELNGESNRYINNVAFFIKNNATIELNVAHQLLHVDTDLFNNLSHAYFSKFTVQQNYTQYSYQHLGVVGDYFIDTSGGMLMPQYMRKPVAKSLKYNSATGKIMPLDLFLRFHYSYSSVLDSNLVECLNYICKDTSLTLNLPDEYYQTLSFFHISDFLSDHFTILDDDLSYNSWINSDIMTYYQYHEVDLNAFDSILKA